MKAKLIQLLISTLISMLTPDLLKKFVDMILDWVEDMVLGSSSTVDDKIVLPICKMI